MRTCLQILQGAERVLRCFRPIIVCEVLLNELPRASQLTAEELFEQLSVLEYAPFIVRNGELASFGATEIDPESTHPSNIAFLLQRARLAETPEKNSSRIVAQTGGNRELRSARQGSFHAIGF
jgi:hypothetical protein